MPSAQLKELTRTTASLSVLPRPRAMTNRARSLKFSYS